MEKSTPEKRKLSSSDLHGFWGEIIAPDRPSTQNELVEDRKGLSKTEGSRTSNFTVNSAHASDAFQLKVHELISQVRLDYGKRLFKAEQALQKLKNIIEQIPNRGPLPLSQAAHQQREFHNIRIPFPRPWPDNDSEYLISYSKPARINVVGNCAGKTALQLGGQVHIDLAVTMPLHEFQKKDYLNYRYFYKRAYYLACIATGIDEDKDCNASLRFAYQNDNKLQPVIVVSPSQDGGEWDFSRSKCVIRIILACEEGTFPLPKTLPNKNCIRPKAEGTPSQKVPPISTPFYNASLRSECSSLSYLKYLHAVSVNSEGFADACILGSVWLRQRGFSTGTASGGFGPFEWACTLALLMAGGGLGGKPVLSRSQSSYQLFKATLRYLFSRDLVANPAFVQSDELSLVSLGQPMLFDGARGMNIMFKMTPWSYANLRHEACLTLKLFDNPLLDAFGGCFISRIDSPLLQFGYVSDLDVCQCRTFSSTTKDATDEVTELCQRIYRALKRGLGDRVTLINLKPPPTPLWDPATSTSSDEGLGKITIGLVLHPEQLTRTVDRGPSVESKEAAAEFRAFWGEKAELRRFGNGIITESLIWSNSNPNESITTQIVTYVLRRHVAQPVKSTKGKNLEQSFNGLGVYGEGFDRLLLPHNLNRANSDTLTSFQPMMDSFTSLDKQMRSLVRLPLQIRQLSAADPQLRYASLDAPLVYPTGCRMKPANIFVQFESSTRWPDDSSAVQRAKVAFLLKIGELLGESTVGLTAQLGLETTSTKTLDAAFLDIACPSGALFRLRVYHEWETNVLERALKDKAHIGATIEDTSAAFSTYKRDFVQAILHTQAVRTLVTRFPLLSPCMRMLKKWRECHLLSHYISDELIELLVIRTFLQSSPWEVPNSIMMGFLQTLAFLSRWNWRLEPLVVDFNGEMGSEDIAAIHMRFVAWRKMDPAMNRISMFAASNLDPGGIAWTALGPSKVVASRFATLAKRAIETLKHQGLNFNPEALFVASLDDYDFVIHINFEIFDLKRDHDKEERVIRDMQIQCGQDRKVAAIMLVLNFLSELRTFYGNSVLFFENRSHCAVIGGLWNPQTGPRPWRVDLQYPTLPLTQEVEEGAKVIINKASIFQEIARLGGDMVSKVEAKR